MRHLGRSLAPLLMLLAMIVAARPALADNHVEFATFDNKSAVAANDFKLRGLNGSEAKIVAASIKRLDGSRVFPDTVLAIAAPICHWPKDRLMGPEIPGAPADSQVTVAAEFVEKGDGISRFSTFTRNDVDILTSVVDTKIVRNDSPSGGSYALVNNESTESVVLTNIQVRINGDPSAIFNIGNYAETGTLVSSTASVTLTPGASQTFLTTGAPANRAVTIRFDAALVSSPSRVYFARRADVVPVALPNLKGFWPVALAGALVLIGGSLVLRRREERRVS